MGKLVTVYLCQGRNRKTGYSLLLSGTEPKNYTEYFCHGKIGYTIILSGTEPQNWLQGTSLRDRIEKLVIGYFCERQNWKTGYRLFLLGTELENWLRVTSLRD